MGSKSVGRSRTPQPTFRRRRDFSPVSTLAAGDFMSEMHEATPVSQPFPHFERLVDSREADRKIVALPHIGSRRVGAFEVKVSQLSVPSLTTEDRDETDEISARQPSDREACRWPESLGVPMVRTPGGWQSDATQSNGWIARTISERDGGSEGRRR